ncbi:MAG: single-stranded-DNA-specific exonuclease RecJ [Huintestinicola sp.]
MKKWIIGTPDENAVRELCTKGGLSSLTAAALVSAGIDTYDKAAEFFGRQNSDDESDQTMGFSSPYLIRDMERACELISGAVDDGTLICVYGDYDCDGVTSTAVLCSYLMNIGGNVTYYINDRSEGYGMNCDAVNRLAAQGVGMIVTVDNGISAVREAELCRELGITLVITDHHQPPEILPDADAVVDPHRADCPSPFKDYCGCGLVLKLISAMEAGSTGDMQFAVEQYSDLAAIATVADIVPLKGENRDIVRHGLHYLENTENFGLQALIKAAAIKPPYTSSSAAFSLSPRINAAGRIGSASDALALLLEEDPDSAEKRAQRICELNESRKKYENAVVAEIAAQIKADPSLLDKRVLVFAGKGWHHGVIGIAAARCMERFDRPVFLMSEDEGEYRGSARSPDGFSIFKALSSCSEHLSKFGGHSCAGGFSIPIENLPAFDKGLQDYAAALTKDGISFAPKLTAVKAISPDELTVENVKGLDLLEPFGEGNQRPVFLLAGAVISDIIPLSAGAHTKLILTSEGKQITALMFSQKTAEFPYRKGDSVNVLISPEINTFRGNSSVNVRVVDISKAGINISRCISAEDAYRSFRRGEEIDIRLIPRMIPDRNDLAAVYRAVGNETLSPCSVYSRISTVQDINYCKVLICLDIFEESGLMEYDRCAGKVHIIAGAPKADTSKAPTYAKLLAMKG